MAYSFTETEQIKLKHASDLMVKGTAYDRPFDDAIVSELAEVAQSSGFQTAGEFKELVLGAPITTMLQWLLWAGSA